MYYARLDIPTRPGSPGTSADPFGATEFLDRIQNTGSYTDEYALWGTLDYSGGLFTWNLDFKYYTNIVCWVERSPWRIISQWDLLLKGNPNEPCWIDGLIFFSPGYILQSNCNAMWGCHIECAGIAWGSFSKPAVPYLPDPNTSGKTVRMIKSSVRMFNKYWDITTVAEKHFHWIQYSNIWQLNWDSNAFENCDVEFDEGGTNRSFAEWSAAGLSYADWDVTYNKDFSSVVWPTASSPDSAFDALFGGAGFELNVLSGDPVLPPLPGTIITADFTADVTAGDAELTVQFTDTSTGSVPTSWAWDFGDGFSAISANPVHVYANPGVYTVTLTASNETSSDTKTRVSYIIVRAPGSGFMRPHGPSLIFD